jgi:hypothetical protein
VPQPPNRRFHRFLSLSGDTVGTVISFLPVEFDCGRRASGGRSFLRAGNILLHLLDEDGPGMD